MKYILLFCGTSDAQKAWENSPPELIAQAMERAGQWFGQHADKLVSSEQLQSPSTAKTVRMDDGVATVTDGPYIESKEVIGGYAVVEVPDEAAAIALAKTVPFGGTVEVRPVVAR